MWCLCVHVVIGKLSLLCVLVFGCWLSVLVDRTLWVMWGFYEGVVIVLCLCYFRCRCSDLGWLLVVYCD